jgi:hypothetical protein
MKFRTTLLILLYSTFLVNGRCKKDKLDPPTVLPPITQTGANTFGCRVNGEVWVPFEKCGIGSNPCGEIVVDIVRTSQNQLPVEIHIGAGQRKRDNTSTAFSIQTKTNQSIYSAGNKIDSVTINFRKNDGSLYYNYNYYSKIERFEITKLDTINKIIAGTFELTLYASPTDSLKITEGRYDLKFQACTCSN